LILSVENRHIASLRAHYAVCEILWLCVICLPGNWAINFQLMYAYFWLRLYLN